MRAQKGKKICQRAIKKPESVRIVLGHILWHTERRNCMAEHLTADNFNEKVIEAKGTVLVDFFATWCGPCRMIAGAVEQLASEYEGKAAVYKLDVDEAQDIAMQYKVMSIPTLIFFKDGKESERIVGAVSQIELIDAMERNL